MVRIIPNELVGVHTHPNSNQLNPESVLALETARQNEGKWVVWQSGFPHHRASKTQAYNLRNGKRQRILTQGLIDVEGDELLEFRAWTDPETKEHCVLARYTTAEFRVHERENNG